MFVYRHIGAGSPFCGRILSKSRNSKSSWRPSALVVPKMKNPMWQSGAIIRYTVTNPQIHRCLTFSRPASLFLAASPFQQSPSTKPLCAPESWASSAVAGGAKAPRHLAVIFLKRKSDFPNLRTHVDFSTTHTNKEWCAKNRKKILKW